AAAPQRRAGDSTAHPTSQAQAPGTFTTPNGRVITLPPGVTADQVQQAIAKMRTGAEPTAAERALLAQVFGRSQRSGGGGRGGGGAMTTRTAHRLAVVATVLVAIASCRKATPAPAYETVPVARRDIIVSATASGVIQPILTLSVKSKASGEIIAMPVQTGDEV